MGEPDAFYTVTGVAEVVLVEGDVGFASALRFELDIAGSFSLYLNLFEGIAEVISVLANADHIKKVQKILPLHYKNPVVFEFVMLELSTVFRLETVPKLMVFIRASALPLFSAPGIT